MVNSIDELAGSYKNKELSVNKDYINEQMRLYTNKTSDYDCEACVSDCDSCNVDW